ncbi:MAG: hypothetical protein V4503_01220 [Gemmatimonadota bacterium]
MTLIRLAVCLTVTICALTSPAAAQRDTLVPGRWRGEITPANDTPYGVTWIVSGSAQRPKIELRIPNGPSTIMGGVKLKGARLTFLWAAGGPRPFFCTLYRDGDGSFGGKCDDPVIGPTGEYVSANVTMWPPGMRRPQPVTPPPDPAPGTESLRPPAQA